MDRFPWILQILSKFHNNYEMPGLLDFFFLLETVKGVSSEHLVDVKWN